jgi:hypothetical protein
MNSPVSTRNVPAVCKQWHYYQHWAGDDAEMIKNKAE